MINKNVELVALLDSYQTQYHYPDFMRTYNLFGLNKILNYYKDKKKNIENFYSVIYYYELKSSELFDESKTNILYKNLDNNPCNVNFDKGIVEDYLHMFYYPIIKIKLLQSNFYDVDDIPNDFNCDKYKNLNLDLKHLSNEELLNHFRYHGLKEGRLYKLNQKIKMPKFLIDYLKIFRLNIFLN